MTAISKKTITSLPDLCLLTIFDSVPLIDVFANVSLTCRQWHSLRHSILTRRTRLHLQLGDNAKNVYDLDDLMWSVLTAERVLKLVTCFKTANIHQLSLAYADKIETRIEDEDLAPIIESRTVSLSNLCMLLHLWADIKPIDTVSLDWESTQVWTSTSDEQDSKLEMNHVMGNEVLAALGRLSALSVLRVNFRLIQASVLGQLVPFLVLGRLSRLEVCSIPNSFELIHFCRWLGANHCPHNDRLQIVLPISTNHQCHINPNKGELEQIYRSGAPLGQFTGAFPEPEDQFAGGDEARDLAKVASCLAHFPRLTEFSFIHNFRTLSQVTRCLSPKLMPQLTHLEMCFDLSSEVRGNLLKIQKLQQHPSHHYQPLPSVRRLSLRMYEYFIHESESLDQWASVPFATVFPGLRVLCVHLEIYSEFEGEVEQPVDTAAGAAQVAQTLRPYVRPFLLGCVHLQEVVVRDFYSRTEHTYTLDQFQ